MRCRDCGCTVYNGLCSNCNEELYILENQSEFIDRPLSESFLKAANEQKLKRDKLEKEFEEL